MLLPSRSRRALQGILRGYDQTVNLILDECHERVYNTDKGVDRVTLGLYIIRGDNVYVDRCTRALLSTGRFSRVAAPLWARSTKTRKSRSTCQRLERSL